MIVLYITVLVYLGIMANNGNWAQKPQIKGTDTQKAIQSVKLHISHHQMKLC